MVVDVQGRAAQGEDELDPVAAAHATIRSERDTISRELHDIVSHSVTVMVLQAAGAERILDRDPARARAALVQVQHTGTHAMEELGRMLRVLRAGAGGAGYDDVARPGIGDIGDLVAETCLLGPEVELVQDGPPGAVDASVGLTAYRVVQESLTNLVRHGAGAPAVVGLHWADSLLVEVVNGGGRSCPPPLIAALSTGHGLVGLRERIAVVGGELETGVPPGGGFRVRAWLPVCRRHPVAHRSPDAPGVPSGEPSA